MKLFNCNVRLGGNLLHSIPKLGITEKEMYLLRAIHGDDSIENIKQVGESDMEERPHLMSLARVYGKPIVEKTFTVILDGFEEWLQSVLDSETEEREEREAERRAEAEKNSRKAAEKAANPEAATTGNETKTVTLE
jgi:hypothetical protein